MIILKLLLDIHSLDIIVDEKFIISWNWWMKLYQTIEDERESMSVFTS